MFLIGGHNPPNSAQNVVDVYDLDTDSWVTANSLPNGQFKLSVATYAYNSATSIYAVGGLRAGGAPQKEVYKYSFASTPPTAPIDATWAAINDLPEQRLNAQLDVISNKVVIRVP